MCYEVNILGTYANTQSEEKDSFYLTRSSEPGVIIANH